MTMLARPLLRVALVILLLGCVLAQVLVPVFASQEKLTFPEVAYLAAPYSVAAILCIGCGQVALLAVWRLLSLVNKGVIFRSGALRWVDVIMACVAVAGLLSAGVLIHLLVFVGVGGPLLYYLAACAVVAIAFVLLTIVVRGLLAEVIADRTELDAVI